MQFPENRRIFWACASRGSMTGSASRPALATTDRADIRRRWWSQAAGARSATRPRRTAGYSRSWPVRH
jgi:hypothetical protein